MAGVCNTNAILSGLIDYYCLVCEDLFQNVEDVHQHVDTPHHNKILQQTCYVNEYTEHRIRKLRKGYFCEYCNEAFTTSSKMRSHVDSETHVYRRNSKQFSSPTSVLNLSWSGNRVLTSQLLIGERPWNGILDDDTCLVCDEEIDSFEDHKKIWSHVLKLAQTKVLVGKDELSREINDSLFQCLICNIMCPINDYDKHNTTESHIMNHTKALQSTPVSTIDNGDADETSSNNYDNKEINRIGNDKKVEQKQKENNRNYFDEQAAKVFAETEQLPTTSKERDNRDEITIGKVKNATCFAKANNFSYVENANTATCNICKIKVPFYLKNMKEHVNGVVHKNKMAEQNQSEKKQDQEKANISQKKIHKEEIEEIKPYRTVMSKYFVHELVKAIFVGLGAGDEVLLINGHICVTQMSFDMTTRVGGKLMCQLCNEIIPKNGYTRHFKTNKQEDHHADVNSKVPVVKDLEEHEFVREVRPGEFHCVYCNIVIPGWDDLNIHLKTTIHNKLKMEARMIAKQIRDTDDANDMEMQIFLKTLHHLSMMERL